METSRYVHDPSDFAGEPPDEADRHAEADALLNRELAGYYDSQDEDYPRDDQR